MLAYEDGPRLPLALIGCGSHAYRSLFPCFDYLAVDLAAVCDVNQDRAQRFAAHFGARAACASLDEVIARGDVQAVALAVGPRQHPELACQALEAGLHVWMEKPPAMNVAGVDRMIQARDRAGKNVVVGFKKIFMPVIGRMKSFLDGEPFGAIRTVTGRFPTDVPADGPETLAEGRFTDWLGNGPHPLSLLIHLGGRPRAVTTYHAAKGGGAVILEYSSGAVGILHLAAGQGNSGPMERYEVVCERGSMILENNTRLCVYRPDYPTSYTASASFTEGGEDTAALIYEPQHTLSMLNNKAIFLQGFVPELDHFVQSCLNHTAPTLGTLEMARAVMECYEAALLSQGRRMVLDDLPCNRN